MYESLLELDRLWLADADPLVTAIATQPFDVSGLDDDVLRTYGLELLLQPRGWDGHGGGSAPRNWSGLMAPPPFRPDRRGILRSVAGTTRLIRTTVDGVDVWVSAVQTPGTEATSGSPADRLVEAFDKARGAIVVLSRKVAESVEEMAARGTRPDEVSVEFGLSISTEGTIIVASAAAEASLAVTVTYRRSEAAPSHG